MCLNFAISSLNSPNILSLPSNDKVYDGDSDVPLSVPSSFLDLLVLEGLVPVTLDVSVTVLVYFVPLVKVLLLTPAARADSRALSLISFNSSCCNAFSVFLASIS